MLEKILDKTQEKLAPYWHDPFGGLLTALFTGFAAYIALVFDEDISPSSPLALGSGIGMGLIILALWFKEHHVPKVPKGKVGIILAVSADDDEEAKRVKSDFTTDLIRRLRSDSANSKFTIVPLKGHLVEKLELDLTIAPALVAKYRGHFLLRAFSRRRLIGGTQCHHLRIEALVTHGTIPAEVSKEFSVEMRKLIPSEFNIAVDGDVIAFEATSQQISLGARFSIAIAAALTGDLVYARTLLERIESEITSCTPTSDSLAHLAKVVPLRLADVYSGLVRHYGHLYHLRRDKTLLEKLSPICARLLELRPTDTLALSHMAIADFTLRRDIGSARKRLLACDRTNPVGYYGLAFLSAYEGNLQEAHEIYRTAFRKKLLDGTIPIQSEEFISRLIAEEPDKSHLLFCLGLINYNAKRDYSSAKQDFEQFLQIPKIDQYPWAKGMAIKLSAYCDRYE